MSNLDYLYTQDMVDSGRTAELTAGERLREKADMLRDEAKENICYCGEYGGGVHTLSASCKREGQ